MVIWALCGLFFCLALPIASYTTERIHRFSNTLARWQEGPDPARGPNLHSKISNYCATLANHEARGARAGNRHVSSLYRLLYTFPTRHLRSPHQPRVNNSERETISADKILHLTISWSCQQDCTQSFSVTSELVFKTCACVYTPKSVSVTNLMPNAAKHLSNHNNSGSETSQVLL